MRASLFALLTALSWTHENWALLALLVYVGYFSAVRISVFLGSLGITAWVSR